MIDEKKLIEELEKIFETDEEDIYCTLSDFGYHVLDCVKEQPKVGEWIPCSERLPEDGETYLITNKESFCQNNTYKGWYDGNIWHMNGNLERKMNVIAWMPLPEPYREGQEIKKQTNADRIRNMTDEELANFLMDISMGMLFDKKIMNVKYWLQSEVEEEDE